MDLYADYHPKTSVKGYGFANADKARETLKMLDDGIKNKNSLIHKKIKENPNYVNQVVITMYYRAKHHPKRTGKMEEAMEVYRKFMVRKGIKINGDKSNPTIMRKKKTNKNKSKKTNKNKSD